MEQFLKITINTGVHHHDILIAELGAINYDSFQEQEEALEAYIVASSYEEDRLLQILDRYHIRHDFQVEALENINWNEQWEKNFDPVYISDQVQIRATFHQPLPAYRFDIIINPKMSFGTGHHETTHLIVAEQLSIDHKNKCVLDVGTGTGVLAIMAHKLGASSITVTDIDDWCISNCRENFELNNLENFDILQGTIDKLTLPGTYDIIFANINKNVLLEEMKYYEKLLAQGGHLILSGFYEEDLPDITDKAKSVGLSNKRQHTRNNWAMLHLKR
jgi:ribosomal protein L11 methyltransferase